MPWQSVCSVSACPFPRNNLKRQIKLASNAALANWALCENPWKLEYKQFIWHSTNWFTWCCRQEIGECFTVTMFSNDGTCWWCVPVFSQQPPRHLSAPSPIHPVQLAPMACQALSSNTLTVRLVSYSEDFLECFFVVKGLGNRKMYGMHWKLSCSKFVMGYVVVCVCVCLYIHDVTLKGDLNNWMFVHLAGSSA